MPLHISEVQSEAEFRTIGSLLQEAYKQPLNSFWEILKGETEAECTSRYWAWHVALGSHWLQAKDTETGEVIGACEWIIHDSNPYENGNPIPTADWWTNANLRNITDQTLYTFFSRRPATMSKPHILVNICCVSPKHRRRGAGRLLLEWGCKVGDEKDLEGFVESTEDGVKLYESTGFVKIESFVIDPTLPDNKTKEDAADWMKLKEQNFPAPYTVWLMRRPKKSEL